MVFSADYNHDFLTTVVEKLHPMYEILPSLGIMGDYLKVPLKPFNTIVL